MNNIGKRIKEYRKKKDITQEKLAEYLNISSQAVSKWETGVAILDISMLIPLSRLLNVSTDEYILDQALKVGWLHYDENTPKNVGVFIMF